MRVVLSADMEAVTQIRDVREVLACRPEYWKTGRPKLTRDVVAAAEGLLEGGATEVIVLDNHGSGNPWNVLLADLPAGTRPENWNVFDLPHKMVDAMFQLGYHPPAGAAGFVPHSYIPGLRLRVGGEEVGESHGRIWAAQAPLLGIVGHPALERTLGSLGSVPFLAVQKGEDAHRAVPVYRDGKESSAAIRDFARSCMREIGHAPRPAPPTEFTFQARVDRIDARTAGRIEHAGWTQVTDDQFLTELPDWAAARDPLAAAMLAAMAPFLEDMSALDLTSYEAFQCQEPARTRRLTSTFLKWTAGNGEESAVWR